MNARFVGAVAVSLLISRIPIAAQQFERKPTRIADPYSEEHFSCDGRTEGRFHNNGDESLGYSGFRIVADLNFDGRPDLILSKYDEQCAKAGCGVTIYLMQSDRTYVGVDFLLHPVGSVSEQIARGRGRLVTYAPYVASEGTLFVWEVTADAVTGTDSWGLHFDDSTHDKELYDHWFEGKVALHPDYARCVGGQLRWSDSLY